MIEGGKKYLITTDNWFRGPDGHNYSAAYGKCQILTTEKVFDFTPARPSTNWFVKVGEGEGSIIIAGCQIHYAIMTDKKPVLMEGEYTREGQRLSHNCIYIAE